MTEKLYKCTCCGEIKKIRTNHSNSVYVYCPNCSCKAFYKGEENSYVTPEHRHSRKFEFISE